MRVVIYSDGGADPNPGVGGWAAILRFGAHERILTGNDPHTTNNRMELQAAIAALEALNRPCEIEFYTDSEYMRRGITEWISDWQASNWRRKGQPIPNRELWQTLDQLAKGHQINWHWVKGHSGDALNERVDRLATAARSSLVDVTEPATGLPRLFVRASCKGNPGPGGWGAVLEINEHTEQISGWSPSTTNNRMELAGVVSGLELVPEGPVLIFTTSEYVYQGATRWIQGWTQRRWKKKGGGDVANADLWRQILALSERYDMRWVNAKGRDDRGLDEASRLARQAALSVS